MTRVTLHYIVIIAVHVVNASRGPTRRMDSLRLPKKETGGKLDRTATPRAWALDSFPPFH